MSQSTTAAEFTEPSSIAEDLPPSAYQSGLRHDPERLPPPVRPPELTPEGARPGRRDASYLSVGLRQTAPIRPNVTPRGWTPRGPVELDSWWDSRGSSPRDTRYQALPEGFCNRDDPRAQPASSPSLTPTPQGPHTRRCVCDGCPSREASEPPVITPGEPGDAGGPSQVSKGQGRESRLGHSAFLGAIARPQRLHPSLSCLSTSCRSPGGRLPGTPPTRLVAFSRLFRDRREVRPLASPLLGPPCPPAREGK